MLNITTRGFKLRNGIEDKVHEELQRVAKMLPESAGYDVTIVYGNNVFKCDITIKHIGTFVRGEAISDDVLSAVDFAVDDLKRKLRKLKTKMKNKQSHSKYASIVADFDDVIDDDDEFALAREKYVDLCTMNDEEAALQMDMLGHNFFVYLDENGCTSVIYKRNGNGTSYGKLICR